MRPLSHRSHTTTTTTASAHTRGDAPCTGRMAARACPVSGQSVGGSSGANRRNERRASFAVDYHKCVRACVRVLAVAFQQTTGRAVATMRERYSTRARVFVCAFATCVRLHGCVFVHGARARKLAKMSEGALAYVFACVCVKEKHIARRRPSTKRAHKHTHPGFWPSVLRHLLKHLLLPTRAHSHAQQIHPLTQSTRLRPLLPPPRA